MSASGMCDDVRIFKTKYFQRFATKANINDDALRDAIDRALNGQIDADLGGSVIKQRVARQGQGKSGGFRTIILFRHEDKAFFAYGFAKSDQDNISKKELAGFRDLAQEMLAYDDDQLTTALTAGAIVEVENPNDEQDDDQKDED